MAKKRGKAVWNFFDRIYLFIVLLVHLALGAALVTKQLVFPLMAWISIPLGWVIISVVIVGIIRWIILLGK